MNMHQPQDSWHARYAVADRQRVVQILSNTLRDMQGANYDTQRGATIAQEFEKYTFIKSQSRDEYLRLIKQKIQQLRTNMNNRNGGAVPPQQQQQIPQPLQQPQQQQQPQPPQQQQQNMAAARGGPVSGVPNGPGVSQQNKMKPQNMNFLQQQAQARQQSAAQIQAQMRNNSISNQNQQVPQQSQSQQVPLQQNQMPDNGQTNIQSTHQQIQQISNSIRNSPIPPALLAKIPNIPSGVNTWTQVFECYQKKIIPASAMPLIKDIHNTHLQLAIRQQQQQKLNQMQAQQRGGQPNQVAGTVQPQQPPQAQSQPQNQQHHMNMNNAVNNSTNNTPVMNNMGFNVNNLTPQQKQQFLQRQMQQRNSMAGSNNQPLMQQNQPIPQQPAQQLQQQIAQQQIPPQQNRPAQQIGGHNVDGSPKPPNFQITQQDIMKYSSDALALLYRVQGNRSIQTNLDPSQKESFIRKYIIHQKTQLWKEQNGLATNNNRGSPALNNQAMNQKRLQQQQAAGQANPQAKQQLQQQNQLGQNPSAPAPVQQSPMMGNISRTPVMKSQVQMNTLSSPLMAQRGAPMNQMQMNNANANFVNPVQANTQPNVGPAQPVQAPGNAVNNASNTNQPPNRLNARNSIAAMLPPLTDEMKMQLRQLLDEVSRNNVVLKDVTNLLSPQEKQTVRETMVKIVQQYSNVDNIISYFFILTKIVEGTKRLIQMKCMTKNIMDNLQRGIYLAGPDLLEKLSSQYRKYFDYVKEQFNIRRQQLQNQQGRGNQAPVPGPAAQGQQIKGGQQFLNMPGSVGGNVAPTQHQQQHQSMSAPNQQQVNLGPANSWPNVAANQPQPNNFQQKGGNVNSSPMFPNNASPLMVNQIPPGGNQSTAAAAAAAAVQKHAKPPQPPAPQAKKAAVPANRRKGSNKGPINVSSIPTPAGTAPTPGSLNNAIKTPNSIATPQVNQGQSNKNTPSGQSPNYTVKSASGSAPIQTTDADIFTHSKADSKAAKRRELSNTDPEKFFYASLANLLELDESAIDVQNISSSVSTPVIANGKPIAKSPLSPAGNGGEWTCEIRAAAITSAFRQVDSIKELVSNDVISNCTVLAIEESAPAVKNEDGFNSTKRGIDAVDDGDEIDSFFTEKKPKIEDDDYRYLYEPVGFEEWKQFVVSSIQ